MPLSRSNRWVLFVYKVTYPFKFKLPVIFFIYDVKYLSTLKYLKILFLIYYVVFLLNLNVLAIYLDFISLSFLGINVSHAQMLSKTLNIIHPPMSPLLS